METRKPKKPICADFGLGKPLEAFKPGPFPNTEDILRHFFFQRQSLKKPDGDVACCQVVDALFALWKPSKLPLMTRKNARVKVKDLYERFRKLWDHKSSSAAYLKKKAAFLAELKTRFDISAKDALEIIDADKTLLPEDREEDKTFLLAIRENRPHSLGPIDIKREKRLKRAAERDALALARAAKEEERNRVSGL